MGLVAQSLLLKETGMHPLQIRAKITTMQHHHLVMMPAAIVILVVAEPLTTVRAQLLPCAHSFRKRS